MSPLARKTNILEEWIGDEVVLYDTANYQAYHLNASTAAVWRRCDGVTDVAEIIEVVETFVGKRNQDKSVKSALFELISNGLVEGRLPGSYHRSSDGESPGAVDPNPLQTATITRLAVPSPAAAASAAKAVLIADG